MDEKSRDIALFRLSVLGPLASRATLARGELKKIIKELASKPYNIPYSRRRYVSEKTIEHWYYSWLRGGFDALVPETRSDKGTTRIDSSIQEIILSLKKEQPSRSINTIKCFLETKGLVAKNEISRSCIHRFLQQHQLSKRTVSDATTIERRSFEAAHACDIWHGDVMYGPSIFTPNGKRRVYLVSLIDDASRLMAHSAFCFGEMAVDIEGVLKQALLKRGIPRKIIIDNGPAYRAKTLQMICAQLGIRLIYCRPYEPQGKGKLERWHRTCREQFLSELIMEEIKDIDDLNSRLWSWLETIYHQRPHGGLANNTTPIERWRRDLTHIQLLGNKANHIDNYFYHRIRRRVKKDGTVSWQGNIYEVPYELSRQSVQLVIDPHEGRAIKVESFEGECLGQVHLLDKIKNCHRKRQRPHVNSTAVNCSVKKESMVEVAHKKYQQQQLIFDTILTNQSKEN